MPARFRDRLLAGLRLPGTGDAPRPSIGAFPALVLTLVALSTVAFLGAAVRDAHRPTDASIESAARAYWGARTPSEKSAAIETMRRQVVEAIRVLRVARDARMDREAGAALAHIAEDAGR